VKFDGYNLRNQPLDDVFAEIEKVLGVRLGQSAVTYGTQGATVGFPTSADTWVRVAWRKQDEALDQSWTGMEVTSAIMGVKKPDLYRSYRWLDPLRSVVWRADECELIGSKAIHHTGVIDTDPTLSTAWWESLKSSLAALGDFATQRVGMSQAHLTRRINQVFGGEEIDTNADDWRTAHADLHLGNLTAPDCYILDWDDWGLAPRGLDAATLWGHSLLVPNMASRVQDEFADDLNTRSGLLAQLLFCSNVIRLNSGKSTPSPLLEPARHEASRLVDALRT
jgi:hypothetical protein